MTATAGPLAPGDPTWLGDHELLGRLGSGGMGVVYLGRSPDGREVAVKVIRDEIAGDPEYRARFAAEIAAAATVGGAFTARVLDADPDAAQPYLVTEYVEGPTLKAAIVDSGPVAGDRLTALAVGIAEAIGAVHDAGIVHRDLKPSNVLLAEDGPMVIDFGIAQPVDAVGGASTETVIGTPVTMAPERYDGAPVTPAADVFSWGCVVAYAANGRFPFGEGHSYEVGYRVLHEEPDLGALDGDLRELVAAALDKDPALRPDVEQVLARLLGEDDPERQRAAAVAFVRRAWPLAGLAIVAPLGAAHLAGRQPSPPPPAPEPPPVRGVTHAVRRVGTVSKRALVGKGSGVGRLIVQHKVIAAVVGAAVVAAGAGAPRVFAAKPADAARTTTTTLAGPVVAGGPTSTIDPSATTVLDPSTTTGATTTTLGPAGAAGTTTTTAAITSAVSAVSASPASFEGTCPVSVTFSGGISVSRGPATVTFRWLRSDGAAGETRAVRFTGSGAQRRTVRTVMPVGGPGENATAWAQLRVLSPTAETTARRNVTAACATPPRLRASVSVDPTTFTGPCPKVFTFTAVISITDGPATVRYRWTRADGAIAPIETVTFSKAGPSTATVQTTWTLGAAPNTYNLWQSIDFLSESGTANRANFTLTCTAPPG
jgi:hypothetical protein